MEDRKSRDDDVLGFFSLYSFRIIFSVYEILNLIEHKCRPLITILFTSMTALFLWANYLI